MRRVVPWVVVAAVLGAACKDDSKATHAETATPAPAAHAGVGADPLPHPLLWAAEKAGKTTYLLGTMHMGVDAETRLPPIVWRKLHDASAFAMETNLDDAASASLIRPTQTSLRAALGDAYWAKLEDAVGAGAAGALDHLPPMVPAVELSLRGLPQTAVMDRALAARAAREHKRVVFLEPASRQIAILLKWLDVRALKFLLDDLPERERHTRAMLAAYIAGDERQIVALGDSEKDDALGHGYSAAEYEQEMNEMIYDRNASWIDAIEELHGDGGGFVAVGAMHLVGPRSVLDLLAHRGFTVTRIAP